MLPVVVMEYVIATKFVLVEILIVLIKVAIAEYGRVRFLMWSK